MLYRVLKEVPLNFKDALQFMQYIIPATLIAGIHHPDAQSQSKYIQLQPHGNSRTGDILFTNYSLESTEKKVIDQREKLFSRMLFRLGCLPLKKVTPAIGSSIHYAGTLPFSKKEEMFTVQPNGRLSQTKNVFIADGSGFTFLPAKGITLTLMANAHTIALNALQHA
jgi:choline dehydrogenase-like flavoprotein